jgi:hypothetical protein
MSEFTRENEDNGNNGYDFTADFDQIGRYLLDVSDGDAFRECVGDVMGNYLEETHFQSEEPFVSSNLELDLPDGRIAHLSRFGARETAKPFVVLIGLDSKSYERYTLGDDGVLMKLVSSQQATEYDETDSERSHYLKITQGQPLDEGEASNLMRLLREGQPRTK